MLMSEFFKDTFQQNFKVLKSIVMKYVIVKSQIIRYIKGQLFYYNVALYILVQSEEEYSLIWKAKPLTIQIDKGKW